MVQLISLEILKPILENEIKVSIDKDGVDFLELLLKSNQKIKNSSKYDFENSDTITEKIEKKVKMDKKEENLNIEFISTPLIKIEQIKKVIISNIKQQNIILSKSEVKEFKKIDNIKKLIEFANKKGLNIEKIKFEIEPADTISSHKSINKSIPITTNQLLVSKTISKTSTKPKKEIKLETIIHTQTKTKDNKTIHKIDKKIDKSVILEKVEVSSSQISQPHTKKSQSSQSITTPKTTQLKIDKSDTPLHTPKKEIANTQISPLQTKIVSPQMPQQLHQKGDNPTPTSQIAIQSPILFDTKPLQKRVIESFKTELNEAIKNYKPPISKVNIELNPKNLGKVEVTIIKRGNHIQVNMSSDYNNINFFQTHQAEFRQALTTIGFSNIDMNFNSNQKDKKHQNPKRDKKEIKEIDIKANYRYA
jgi:hypothetical protein